MFFHAPPQSAPLNHIKVTQSLQGVAVPLVFGTARLAAKLVYAADLTAHPESTSGKAKGGKSGLYAYTGTFIGCICQGPILGVNSVWNQQGKLPIASTQVAMQVPPAGPQIILSVGPAEGSLPARTYYAYATYVTATGEGGVGAESAPSAMPADHLCTVITPAASTGATGWNLYMAEASGAETLQNTNGPIAIGTDWTEPLTGLIGTGATPPTQPTSTPPPPPGGGSSGAGGQGGGSGYNGTQGVTGPSGPLKQLPVE